MKITRSPFSEQTTEDLKASYPYMALAVVCLFLVVILRLWYLQIVRGGEYRLLSESNRTRVQDILPPRGLILDRNGQILVDNHPAFELAVIREDVTDLGELARRLSNLLNRPYPEVYGTLDAAKTRPAFQPVPIISNLSRDELGLLSTYRYELPGLVIQVKPQRKYLHEGLAAHVIGYLGEITQAQLDQKKYVGYRMGDLVGRYGIEQENEKVLKGQRGTRLVEVDASGRVLKVIKQTNPTPGYNIHLTLDTELQQAAQDALEGIAGAVVALDAKTGEVLAMASNPTFSQNDFVQGITTEQWKELVNNPLHPLENRAVSGQYPPGSVFKIVAAVAALEEGIVTPDTKIFCSGGFPFGNRVFHCWKKTGHGPVDLHRALVESCDVYFYEVGRRLGVNRLADYSMAFGLGMKTGVGLANEKPGLVPTTEWKKKRFKAPWHPGETISVVIGQGYNLATPLQLAEVAAVAANGGALFRPHLVREITDADGNVIRFNEPEVVRRLNLKPTTVKAIRAGLAGVVNEPRGTGSRARLEGITVGGKTGTAQVVGRATAEANSKEMPYQYRDHAWFVACAPMEDPQIAVAALVEHGGHGGSEAAPVARKVLETYFHRQPDKQAVEPVGEDAEAVMGD